MYQARRKQILEQMGPYSMAIFYSGIAPYKVGDEKYPFCVDRNFYYLTGLERENMYLLLFKYPNMTQEVLLIERYDEWLAKWVGARMLPEEARAISKVEDVAYIEDLDDRVGSFLCWYQTENPMVYADFSKQEMNQANTKIVDLVNIWKEKFPWLTIKSITKELTKLRLCKDESEIECLKKAIHVTNDGIEAMMKHVKEGMNESEVEAYFDFALKSQQCEHSFPSIVAEKGNATTLHYAQNNSVIEPDALVLTDLGAAYSYYCADITRTFPASGKFTPRQKEVYEVVLNANKHIIEYAKPGMTLRYLNQELIRYYQETLPTIGLLKNGKTVRDYYFHGVSHMLGLETHDVSLIDYPLVPGNVFTVEPGLYITEEQIGVRIEDDVLMTEHGCVNLSSEIIKEVADIEAFMKHEKGND
ncbi:MAG: Xaa-Pro aminopeptidase [Erysipelotrichaceae bacterium]|nr:Xaa-Pro aminopeptidase [Erysipelotrichaceae bacterium]